MTHTTKFRVASLLPFLTLVACSSSDTQEPLDGTTSTTGLTTTGGTTGGPATTTGGTTTSGGSTTGGPSTTGASVSATTTGGSTTSGSTTGAGGTTGTTDGGTTSVGGATTGDGGATTGTTGSGTTGPGNWGLEEDPGAACTVPEMPSVDSLTANAKLPDPFMKMDGTRITDKSEWVCRRKEILEQTKEFIFGDKPVPPEGSVSGSVSSNSITVNVDDGTGSTSFMVSVSMNGATAPAPAIIKYSNLGGAPVPNGVASITFDPIEKDGGSGPKTGPYYSMYGDNSPTGYLAAQAWQISRLIDLLEQDPSVIDPTKIGVTGCSRYGKGAFIAGVLDNRIALTIPVESGLGGTVGLRLVEVMDSYSGSEWPYHGISYVRWMSEVQLGRFTTGNSAGADNTDKLPIDMHELMGMIAPRGLYMVDNPSTMYNGLDRNAAWVTANAGKLIFEALGVGDNMSYQGAGGTHCDWRAQQYQPKLDAMIDKFLKGNASAQTGGFDTDLPNPPSVNDHIDWEPPTLSGEL